MQGAKGGTTDSAGTTLPESLHAAARAIVLAPDPMEKVRLAQAAGEAWRERRLSLGAVSTAEPMPDRPGRPPRPELLPPRAMPKRSTGKKGRIALLHSLAHIELNAVDMTWDLIGRFVHVSMPRAFFDDWVQVGCEEAGHFALISERLGELGAGYGDLPAHDGLWQAAQATAGSLVARMAIVPLVLEARGLDVSPPIIASLEAAGDHESAAVLGVIYRDEKRHVAFGAKWFRHLCEQAGLAPEPTFHDLVRRHFRGAIKPPFNDRARAEAGLTPGFFKPLMPVARIA
jgi:uncharacterized ferritin-like protein (DUF455 family)